MDLDIEASLTDEGYDVETVFQVEADAWCRRVLARHWPHTVRHDDVRTVGAHNLPRVGIIHGGSPCFVAGTPVLTETGEKPIEAVGVGELVFTHGQRLRPVVRTMRRDGAAIVEVKAFGATVVETTEDHPFYARRRYRAWNNEKRNSERRWTEAEWVAAKDLTPDHFIAQVASEVAHVEREWESPAFWYMVGRWLGDGWIVNFKRKSSVPQGKRGSRVNSRMKYVMVCCALDEADDLAAHFARAGVNARPYPERTVVKFRIGSSALVDFLSQFGRGASNKFVPEFVFSAPEECLRSMWRGWVESDGHTYGTGKVSIGTISQSLASGMARVGRIVHKVPIAVYRQERAKSCVIEGRKCNQSASYAVNLAPKRWEGFYEKGFCWVPVRSVRRTVRVAPVYNLEVAEDNSYVAGSYVVHNCTDLSYAGARGGLASERSGLWYEQARIIDEVRPRVALWENVAGARSPILRDGRCEQQPALGIVLGDLSACGYDAVWFTLRASDVGAPHRRERIFVVGWYVGHAHVRGRGTDGFQGMGREVGGGGSDPRDATATPHADSRNVADAERDAAVQQHGADVFGRRAGDAEQVGMGRGERSLADADRSVRRTKRDEFATGGQQAPRGAHTDGRGDSGRGAQPRLGGDACRPSDGMDAPVAAHRWPARPGEAQHEGEPPRVTHEAEDHANRLRALGNIVVPQCGYVVGKVVAWALSQTG